MATLTRTTKTALKLMTAVREETVKELKLMQSLFSFIIVVTLSDTDGYF